IALAVPILVCPSVPTPNRFSNVPVVNFPAAVADYAVPVGVSTSLYSQKFVTYPQPGNTDGVLNPTPSVQTRPQDVTDGTSNSLLLTEDAGRPQLWQAGKLNPTGNVLLGGWAEANGHLVRGYSADGLSNQIGRAHV